MKRLAFLFILLSFTLSSCIEGDTVVQGSLKTTYTTTIQTRQWSASGTYGQPGYYLYATINASYITNYVLDQGLVAIYTYFDGREVQLPYIISRQVGASNFVEILSYELEPGRISFILDASDFQADPYDTPLAIKVVVIE